jgi:UDP-glucose 4-epimerase
VHLAGANEVEASRDPDGALAGTVAATRRVAVAVAAVGVPRLVYVSTVHVYGAALAEDAEISEATVPAPRHPYAISRLASEHTAAAAVAGDALVVFRLTNAVGAPAAPRVDRWSLLVNDLCRQAVNVGTVTLKSAGDQWRDFIPATDAISAIASAAEAGRVPAGTYNLGSGRPRTVRDVAMLVQDAFEARTGERPPLIAPDPSGPAPRPYRVDIGRLAAQGLAPKSDLPVAIDETAAFCLEHRAALEG